MRYGAALGAAFVTAALVLTARAGAAEPVTGAPPASATEAVSLLYEDSPPPDCPTEAEFEAEVEKLTTKVRFTKERQARRVRIELSSGPRDVVGRLVTGDGKNQSSRELRGKTCREVASALAISVALTLDPDALLGPTEPTVLPEDPPPPEPTTATPKPAAKPPATRPRPARSPATPPREPPPPSHALQRLHAGLGLGLVLENAWSPRMRPGAKLQGVGALGERWRASVGVARFLTREDDDVSFDAWLFDGALSYNVAVLGVVRPFASIGYEFGMIRASGSGLPETVSAERPWHAGSIGLGIRLETDFLFLQVGGNLLVPLSRQRYLVSDPFGKVRTLYEVPELGLRQETVLGVFL